MLRKFLFALVAINYLCGSLTARRRSFALELYSVAFINVTEHVKEHSGSLTKLDNSSFAISATLTFARQLSAKAEIRVLIHIRLAKARKSIKFVDLTLNICDSLEQLSATPLIKALYIEMTRTSNVPLSCPLVGNYSYNVSDFVLSTTMFPTYTPIMQFNYTLIFRDNRELVCIYELQGVTIPRV